METRKNERSTPRGVIRCLSVGFEMLGQHPELVALPVLLDLLLWLGPRVSVMPLLQRFSAFMEAQAVADPQRAGQVTQAAQLLEQVGGRFNLLSLLGGMPFLQLPSLLARRAPGRISPLGVPLVFRVSNVLALVPWWIGLALVGLALGFFYLNNVAQRIRIRSVSTNEGAVNEAHSLKRSFVRVFLFGVGVLSVGAIVCFLWLLVVALAATIAQPLGVLAWALGLGLASYIGLHLIFVVPSILLKGRGLLRAVWESVVLSHLELSSVLGLVALAVVIYEGLGYAWSLPAANSWSLLVGILGNAFVATALTMGSFVFYYDRALVERTATENAGNE